MPRIGKQMRLVQDYLEYHTDYSISHDEIAQDLGIPARNMSSIVARVARLHPNHLQRIDRSHWIWLSKPVAPTEPTPDGLPQEDDELLVSVKIVDGQQFVFSIDGQPGYFIAQPWKL